MMGLSVPANVGERDGEETIWLSIVHCGEYGNMTLLNVTIARRKRH